MNNKQIIETRGGDGGGLCLQLELVDCGKHCRRCPHGPYWYGYWKCDGTTRSVYIGRKLDSDKARQRLTAYGLRMPKIGETQ